MFWRLMLPSSVFVDQGISEDDELSGDRDEGNLCGFSALCQAEIEGFHIGIDASSRHGSEVEDPAHTRPTAPDDATSFPLARLPRDLGDASTQPALLAPAPAQLGRSTHQA